MNDVLLDIKNGVATVTINRPELMNALDMEVLQQISRAFDEINAEPSLSIAVLTGAGGKAFIAGADIKLFLNLDQATAQAGSEAGQVVCEQIANCSVPVIAAVNGLAFGGGMEFALACDIRLASDNAMFGQQEVLWGCFPGWGGTQRLPRLIGRSDAMKMILTGDPINAAEAYRIGLVSAVYTAVEFRQRVTEFTGKIVKNGLNNIKYAKKAVARGLPCIDQAGLSLENELWGRCFTDDEPHKRVEKFLNLKSVAKDKR
ncbi:MAG: enoyl-CoA hydratase/isomerase family protein [Syntrophomonadaceae bacterium]